MPRVFSTPGVYRNEIDVSEILVATGISTGGLVGRFKKGPIRRPVLVQNDKNFIEYFGQPYYSSGSGSTGVNPLIPEFGYGAYAAIEFLKESSDLYVVRAFDPGDVYAAIQVDTDLTYANNDVSAGIPSLTATPTRFDTKDYISSIDTIAESAVKPLIVAGISPGTEFNDVAVTIETIHPTAEWHFSYDDFPSDTSASTSALWASSATSGDIATHFPIASQVFKLKVYKKPEGKNWDDLYASSADKEVLKLRLQEVESYYGTLANLTDADGNDISIESVVNGNSKYIYVKANSSYSFDYDYDYAGTSATVPDGTDSSGKFFYNNDRLCKLANGAVTQTNGLNNSDNEFWAYFNNRQELPVQILINFNYNQAAKQSTNNVCAKRLDCYSICQVNSLSQVSYTDVAAAETYGYAAPSYNALFHSYSKIYDNYNDKYLWLPNSIFAAKVAAGLVNPWDTIGGINRGVIQVLDAYKIYTEDEIGYLYQKNINSVMYVPGSGFAFWGNRTAQLKKTSLSNLNVRTALLYVENNIETALFPFVFENNTVQTRLRAWSTLDSFLSRVKAADGIYNYELVIDESNNTASEIAQGIMNVDLYVQPSISAEIISFTTIVTKRGVSFGDYRLKYV
jgi:hypothetical protein